MIAIPEEQLGAARRAQAHRNTIVSFLPDLFFFRNGTKTERAENNYLVLNTRSRFRFIYDNDHVSFELSAAELKFLA